MNNAEDAALKAHFQAELDVMKLTLNQMGITPPDSSPEDVDTPEGKVPQKRGNNEVPDELDENPDLNLRQKSRTPLTDTETEFTGTLPPELERWRDLILQAAEATGVPAERIAAQIMQESGGDPDAVSTNPQMGTTDRGLMQVSSAVFDGLKANYPEIFGKRSHSEISTDPELAIMAGAYHMKDLYEKYGDWDVALRAYVSGETGINVNNPQDASYSPGTDPQYVNLVNKRLVAITGEP
jgi:soluble lytic murein transglycosylase-like protein